MEGMKTLKVFFATYFYRLRTASETRFRHLKSFFKAYRHYLNPFCWPKRLIKVLSAAFFMIMLPIYLFIGLQPTPLADAASYPVLEIPSIDLKTPVARVELIDRQLTVPATIAGIYQPFDNKLFIIGHSSTVFKNLDRLQINQSFTYDGEQYLITDRIILEKSAISMNELLSDAPEKTIIIMTCAGDPLPNQDATHRLIITATLAE